jgi:hypothetical protein
MFPAKRAKREESVRQLLAHIGSGFPKYREGRAPAVLIAGDFNTDPDAPQFAAERTIAMVREAGFVSAFEGMPIVGVRCRRTQGSEAVADRLEWNRWNGGFSATPQNWAHFGHTRDHLTKNSGVFQLRYSLIIKEKCSNLHGGHSVLAGSWKNGNVLLCARPFNSLIPCFAR